VQPYKFHWILRVLVWFVFAVLIAVTSAILWALLHFAGEIFEMDRRLRHYVQVPCKITSSRMFVSKYPGSDKEDWRTTYSPMVEYSWIFEDRTYYGDQLTSAEASLSKTWAEKLLAKYSPGSEHVAYCDPSRPQRAYLVPVLPFGVYAIVFVLSLLASVFLALTFTYARLIVRGTREWQPVARPDGWYEFFPEEYIRSGLSFTLPFTMLSISSSALILGHYFVMNPASNNLLAWICVVAACIIDTAFLISVTHDLWIRVNLSDARLFARTPTLVRQHREHLIRVEQRCGTSLRIKSYKVGLICEREEFGHIGTMARHLAAAAWNRPILNQIAPASGLIKFDVAIGNPRDCPPSTSEPGSMLPHFYWKISLIVEIAGCPKYKALFPIVMKEE